MICASYIILELVLGHTHVGSVMIVKDEHIFFHKTFFSIKAKWISTSCDVDTSIMIIKNPFRKIHVHAGKPTSFNVTEYFAGLLIYINNCSTFHVLVRNRCTYVMYSSIGVVNMVVSKYVLGRLPDLAVKTVRGTYPLCGHSFLCFRGNL